MAERLGEIEGRIESVRQLSAVVSAVRGIAAARLQEARTRLEGVRTYAETIGQAIAQALAFLPDAPGADSRPAPGRRIVVALGAEQGFVGAFDRRILESAAPLAGPRAQGSAELLLLGSRAATLAEAEGLPVAWSAPMATHAEEVTVLANRLADALFDRIAAGDLSEVVLVHAQPAQGRPEEAILVRRLLPFDFGRFPPVNRSQPPLIQLPPDVLLAQLADEYVFAELCEALVLSFAAENEARMEAMVAARENVAHRLEDLTATARRLRQEQITAEVIELAAGAQAQDPAGR